jgi:hypothetical protein
MEDDLEVVTRLSKDLAKAAASLSVDEARYLVDAYYNMQANRIVADNQIRAMDKSKEPHAVLTWLSDQNTTLEGQIKKSLDKWTDESVVGKWLKEITGIGPVLAAGLLAHIDIEQAPTAGHIWRYAGLDPTREWLGKERSEQLVKNCLEQCGNNLEHALILAAGKCNVTPANIRKFATMDKDGETVSLTRKSLVASLAKRPHNGKLKTLCWKIGESFVKVSGNENDRYGHLYIERKDYEIKNNEAGKLAEQAAAVLERKNIGKSTDAYKAYSIGRLPPAHIHSRAKRWAVKIFLSHLHEFWYEQHFGKPAPAPYAIAILGHAHKIKPKE